MRRLITLVLTMLFFLPGFFRPASAATAFPPITVSLPGRGTAPAEAGFSFPGKAGRVYFAEYSPDSAEWFFLPRFIVGDGGPVEWTVAFAEKTGHFRFSSYPVRPDDWVSGAAETPLAEYRLFFSRAVGRPVSYHVSLPPGYAQEKERRYPVLYWLHGSGPGVAGIPRLTRFFHRAFATGLVPPMIIIFPNGLSDGMWCDSRDGSSPVESMFIEDLIPHVDMTLRTIPDRRGRMVEGFSMGGYGAARLGLKHPGLFAAFSALGAGPLQLDFLARDRALPTPLPARKRVFEKVYGGDASFFEMQSPMRLAEAYAGASGEKVVARVVVGERDPLRDNNRLFHRRLEELGIPHEYRELPGVGHDPMETLRGANAPGSAFYHRVFQAPERSSSGGIR